jgi:hypothetical protein
MSVRHVWKWCVFIALAASGSSFGLHKAISAEPVTDVAKSIPSPPAAIEELPPDQRPEGPFVPNRLPSAYNL